MASRPATKSSSTGSTDGSRADRRAGARADAGALPGSGRLRRARRRADFYEVYGEGEPTVLLMPTWSIVHSRHWKMQIPYLARHCRVLTFDGRGNGRSDRPSEPDAYREEEYAADALAVMDATATERAVLVSLSRGAERVAAPRGEPSGAGRQAGVHRAGLPLPPATPRLKADTGLRASGVTSTPAGGSGTATTGSSTTRSSSSSSSRSASPSRTRRSSARTASAGGSTRTRRRWSRRSSRRGSRTRTAFASSCPPSTAPCT